MVFANTEMKTTIILTEKEVFKIIEERYPNTNIDEIVVNNEDQEKRMILEKNI